MAGAAEEQAALFSGLRFFLAGFEDDNKDQFVEEIIANDGQIAERYDSDCTHVIVSKLSYNDPICAAARSDGKVLVIDAWLVNCLDSDILLDVKDVSYRPPIELNGIPGADKLVVCLTNYEGLSRKQVMRMVQLMGARFSKPLLPSAVTHLVCYKFEGEKYKLAKKTGLFLVNHFWLEDCLKAWMILPLESRYTQCGWEAETMKSRDSIAEDSQELEADVMRDISFQVPPSEQTLPENSAQILQQSERDDPKRDRLSTGSKISPQVTGNKSKQKGVSEIGHAGGSEGITTLQDADCTPSDKVSAMDADKDETTDLFVDDGNVSDHSCGRTACEKGIHESDKSRGGNGAMELQRTTTPTSSKMKMPDSRLKRTTPAINNAENLNNRPSPCADTGFNVSEAKRRRYSSEKIDPVDPPRLEPTDLTNPSNDCEPACSDQKPYPSQAPSAKQEILPLVSDVADTKFGQKNVTAKTGLCKDPPDVSNHALETQDPRSTEAHVEKGNVDTGIPVFIEKRSENVSTPNLPESCVDEHSGSALQSKSTSAQGRPGALLDLARSYNPALRKTGTPLKRKSVEKDKENVNENKKKVLEKNVVAETTVVTQATTLEPSKMCFAVGGSTEERTRLHSVIKTLGGKISRSRYQWRDEATHIVLPGPLRRTEKFLAAAAAGRWILKPEYVDASMEAGKFLHEEKYEWFGDGTNDKGTISLQAPRKWRMRRASSGHGAFCGLRVFFYGAFISPPLDTLQRALRAGGGVVLATTPPYSRYFSDGANFAIVNPGIPREDQYVQEFVKAGLACVTSDYFVDLVCQPSSSLEKYIVYETADAVKAAKQQVEFAQAETNCIHRGSTASRGKQVKTAKSSSTVVQDTACTVCGRLDGEDVMLLCGDEDGAGCGQGMHIHCCEPPLQKVPEGDWFCPKCRA